MERLASILPVGGADVALHRGARRKGKRWPLDAEVELLQPVRGAGMAINASVGGIRLVLDTDLPIRKICTFRVRTAPGHASTEYGRVIWCRAQPDGYLMGIEFVDSPQS